MEGFLSFVRSVVGFRLSGFRAIGVIGVTGVTGVTGVIGVMEGLGFRVIGFSPAATGGPERNSRRSASSISRYLGHLSM